jgi:hypothetical protein
MMTPNAPMPMPPTTGAVVTLTYPPEEIATLSLTGTTASGRQFGPYSLSATQAPSASTVGFVFDPSDAGAAMLCGQANDSKGQARLGSCTSMTLRADAVISAELSMDACVAHITVPVVGTICP